MIRELGLALGIRGTNREGEPKQHPAQSCHCRSDVLRFLPKKNSDSNTLLCEMLTCVHEKRRGIKEKEENYGEDWHASPRHIINFRPCFSSWGREERKITQNKKKEKHKIAVEASKASRPSICNQTTMCISLAYQALHSFGRLSMFCSLVLR